MESFSWADGVEAIFSPCLTCLRSSPQLPNDSDDESNQHGHNNAHEHHYNHHRIIRARPDELEGLLAESDADAETLSLHSNIGDPSRNRRKKGRRSKAAKAIRWFGYDLFGRRQAIQLSDDEEDRGRDEGEDQRADNGGERNRNGSRRSRPRALSTTSRTISTDTLDSDAAPLDLSTIDASSAARLAEEGLKQQKEEEERRKLKEERRKLRREKKELKKAAMELAMARAEATGDGGFEGFPGSGPSYGQVPSPFGPHASEGSDISSSHHSQYLEEFGPFEQGIHPSLLAQAVVEREDSADVDGADFGAENYARRTTSGGNSNGTGSDSRSRTSASVSNADSVSHYTGYSGNTTHHMAGRPGQIIGDGNVIVDPITGEIATPVLAQATTPKKKKKSHKSSQRSISSVSQSTGGTVPVSPPPQQALPVAQPMIAAPDYEEHEQQASDYPYQLAGVQGGILAQGMGVNAEAQAGAGFPSVGLGGGGRLRRKNSEAGVFLARRGDD